MTRKMQYDWEAGSTLHCAVCEAPPDGGAWQRKCDNRALCRECMGRHEEAARGLHGRGAKEWAERNGDGEVTPVSHRGDSAPKDKQIRLSVPGVHRMKLDSILGSTGIPSASEFFRRMIDLEYDRLLTLGQISRPGGGA